MILTEGWSNSVSMDSSRVLREDPEGTVEREEEAEETDRDLRGGWRGSGSVATRRGESNRPWAEVCGSMIVRTCMCCVVLYCAVLLDSIRRPSRVSRSRRTASRCQARGGRRCRQDDSHLTYVYITVGGSGRPSKKQTCRSLGQWADWSRAARAWVSGRADGRKWEADRQTDERGAADVEISRLCFFLTRAVATLREGELSITYHPGSG